MKRIRLLLFFLLTAALILTAAGCSKGKEPALDPMTLEQTTQAVTSTEAPTTEEETTKETQTEEPSTEEPTEASTEAPTEEPAGNRCFPDRKRHADRRREVVRQCRFPQYPQRCVYRL